MAYEDYVDFFMEDAHLQSPQIAMMFVTKDDFDLEKLRYIAQGLPYNSSMWYMTVYHYIFTRSPYMSLHEKCQHEVKMRRCWREFQKSYSFLPVAHEVYESQGESKYQQPQVPALPM